MKKVILSFGILMILGSVFVATAHSKVEEPKAVLTSFKKMFPNAEEVRYEHDEDEVMVFFREANTAKYCRLDSKGNWLEKGISFKGELPETVIDAINELYDDAEDIDMYTVELPDGKTGFMVLIESDDEQIEVLIRNDGKVLRERYLVYKLRHDDEG